MRRVSAPVPLIACVLLTSFLLCSIPSAAQQGKPNPTPELPKTQPRSFSINGTVRDAVTHKQLDNVRIELDAVSGTAVATVFTGGDGGFQIINIGDGSYTVVAQQPGFQIASLGAEVHDAAVRGIQIELVRPPEADALIAGTVSERELSIPRKAHDDMEAGLALLYGKSDYQQSLKAFEKATQEYPDYYEAYTQIGIAYMKLADAGDSEKAFRKSIELSQERYPEAYIGLAELYLSGKRFADAEPLSRKAAAIDPHSWQAQSQLARALLGLQRFSEAETYAIAAVTLKPDSAELYLILANVHIQLQNDSALLDDLNHYLKLAPTGSFAEQARLTQERIEHNAASQGLPAAPSATQPH
jgi:Flp pilus assembly protein TadD